MQSIEKRVFHGSIANGVSFLVTFFQSIVLVPHFLKYWGSEKYGVWIALYAFVSLMKMLDNGFQNYIANEFNKIYYSEKEKMSDLIGSSLKIAALFGFFELILGFCLLKIFDISIIGISETTMSHSGIQSGVLVFLAMWAIIGSVTSILNRLMITIGHYSLSAYFGVLAKALELICIYFAISKNLSFSATALIITIIYGLQCLWFLWVLRQKAPQFFPWINKGDFKSGFTYLFKSLVFTFTGLFDQLNTNIQLFAISKNLGASVLPEFTTIRTLSNMSTLVVNIFTGPLTVDLVRFYVQKENNKLQEVFSAIWFASLLLVYLPLVIVTPFMNQIYSLWTRDILHYNQGLFYLLTLSVCFFTVGSPFRLLVYNISHFRALSFASITRTLILAIVLFFWKDLNLLVVGCAILVSEFISSFLLPFIFVKNEFAKFNFQLKRSILLLSFLPAFLLTIYFSAMAAISLNDFNLRIGVSFVALFLLFVLSFYHWKYIPNQIKEKLFAMIPVKFSKFLK